MKNITIKFTRDGYSVITTVAPGPPNNGAPSTFTFQNDSAQDAPATWRYVMITDTALDSRDDTALFGPSLSFGGDNCYLLPVTLLVKYHGISSKTFKFGCINEGMSEPPSVGTIQVP
jgi:hypothetical protein